jgi:hypothetical protein
MRQRARSLQVTLALNDRCKSINGSRILIIGVAYKVGSLIFAAAVEVVSRNVQPLAFKL